MKEQLLSMDALEAGQSGLVEKVELEGAMRRRLQDLGLIAGTQVRCLQKGPSGTPVAFWVRGAAIALRKEDACRIQVRA